MARLRFRAPSLWVLNRTALSASSWSDLPEFYVSESENRSGVPLQGFADKKAAEAARTRLEHEARRSTPIGPFLRSLLPERLEVIVDAAKKAGLPPPDVARAGPAVGPTRGPGGSLSYGAGYSDYGERVGEVASDWWASVAADITPEANAKLWDELFPDFQFYVVSRALFEK
jgi:hypothetical protein